MELQSKVHFINYFYANLILYIVFYLATKGKIIVIILTVILANIIEIIIIVDIINSIIVAAAIKDTRFDMDSLNSNRLSRDSFLFIKNTAIFLGNCAVRVEYCSIVIGLGR